MFILKNSRYIKLQEVFFVFSSNIDDWSNDVPAFLYSWNIWKKINSKSQGAKSGGQGG